MTREQISQLSKLILSQIQNIEIDEPQVVEHGGYHAIEFVVRRKDLGRFWSVGIQEKQSPESTAVAIGKAISEAIQAT